MVSAEDVAGMALSLPGAHQSAHFGTLDFRVRNKIFCTLPADDRAGLRLDPSEQAGLLAEDPRTFGAATGYWGRQGWTTVDLTRVDRDHLRELITEAWRRLAPRKLIAELDAAG